MRNKNGFTIYETIVSIAIVLMISLVILTTTLISNKSVLKSKSLNFGLNEVENVSKIYKSTDVVEGGIIKYDNLKNTLNTFYNQEISYEQNVETGFLSFALHYNNDCKFDSNGTNIVVFSFTKNDAYITLSGKVVYNDSIIYENAAIFEKVVA